MKRLLIALLLIGSSSTFADGLITRQGNIVTFKTDCVAFNLDTFNSSIPEGTTTLTQMVMIFAASLRDLTIEEQAVCNGTPVPLPSWKVAPRSGSTTRPYYELLNPITHERSAKRGDITVGSPCEMGQSYSNPSTGGRFWRYLIGQTRYVSLCEFK